MSGDGRRTQRMAALLRGELAELLLREVSDPALKEVVITEVEISGDLKHARVFYTPSGQEVAPKTAELEKGFKRAMPFLRRRVAEDLKLRSVPELQFRIDTHGDSVARVMHLLSEVSPKDS